MTCHYCTSGDALREKARVSALEQQNTDLIKIVGELIRGRLEFRFNIDPTVLQLKMRDYEAHLVKQAGAVAKIRIEQMLEDRRQFFYDYDLLKMHSTQAYWEARNRDITG